MHVPGDFLFLSNTAYVDCAGFILLSKSPVFLAYLIHKLSFVGTMVRMLGRDGYLTGDGFNGVISRLYMSPPYKYKTI